MMAGTVNFDVSSYPWQKSTQILRLSVKKKKEKRGISASELKLIFAFLWQRSVHYLVTILISTSIRFPKRLAFSSSWTPTEPPGCEPQMWLIMANGSSWLRLPLSPVRHKYIGQLHLTAESLTQPINCDTVPLASQICRLSSTILGWAPLSSPLFWCTLCINQLTSQNRHCLCFYTIFLSSGPFWSCHFICPYTLCKTFNACIAMPHLTIVLYILSEPDRINVFS